MEQPLPIGMGLRVPMPSTFAAANPVPQYSYPGIPAPAVVQETPKVLEPGLDGLCDFDDLTLPQVYPFVLNIKVLYLMRFFFHLLSDEGLHCEADQFPSFCDFLLLLAVQLNRLFFCHPGRRHEETS